MHVHIVTYIGKSKDHFFIFIFHPFKFKTYGVIIQNGDHTLKIHIWTIYNMTMESTPVVPDPTLLRRFLQVQLLE